MKPEIFRNEDSKNQEFFILKIDLFRKFKKFMVW